MIRAIACFADSPCSKCGLRLSELPGVPVVCPPPAPQHSSIVKIGVTANGRVDDRSQTFKTNFLGPPPPCLASKAWVE